MKRNVVVEKRQRVVKEVVKESSRRQRHDREISLSLSFQRGKEMIDRGACRPKIMSP